MPFLALHLICCTFNKKCRLCLESKVLKGKCEPGCSFKPMLGYIFFHFSRVVSNFSPLPLCFHSFSIQTIGENTSVHKSVFTHLICVCICLRNVVQSLKSSDNSETSCGILQFVFFSSLHGNYTLQQSPRHYSCGLKKKKKKKKTELYLYETNVQHLVT